MGALVDVGRGGVRAVGWVSFPACEVDPQTRETPHDRPAAAACGLVVGAGQSLVALVSSLNQVGEVRVRVLLIGVVLIAALGLLGCGVESREVPSACCDCLVDEQCTAATREECGRWVAGDGTTLVVSSQCVNAKGCGPPCAKEGAVWP